jgi:hypothetical protein
MATPLFDALVTKVRDYSNKPEANTIPNSVIKDCLKYSADECYRLLRIPPLEVTTTYTITSSDNSDTTAGSPGAYSSIYVPDDLTQFIYVRTMPTTNGSVPYQPFPANTSIVFHEVTDSRTFFDPTAEKYSVYNFMWKGNKAYFHPQLAEGTVLEICYYRRLPALNATYDVVSYNYLQGLADNLQPYLAVGTGTDTPLYFAGGIPYDTYTEAASHGTVTTSYWTGKEVDNWLRDQNERVLMEGSLMYLGGYLFDKDMESRYSTRFNASIQSLNTEERKRRSSGGNIQMNINGGGLI